MYARRNICIGGGGVGSPKWASLREKAPPPPHGEKAPIMRTVVHPHGEEGPS